MPNPSTNDFIAGSKDLLKKAGRVLTLPFFGVLWLIGLGYVVLTILVKWTTWPYKAIAAHGARLREAANPPKVELVQERVRIRRRKSLVERIIIALY